MRNSAYNSSSTERRENLYGHVIDVVQRPNENHTIEVIFGPAQAAEAKELFPNAEIDAFYSQGKQTRVVLSGEEANLFLSNYDTYKTIKANTPSETISHAQRIAEAAIPLKSEPSTGMFI